MKYIFVSGGRFTTFASIMNNHPKSPIIDLQQQQLLLRMEYEHEKEEFKRQTETMGVARKVKRGLCWYPASPGRSYYNSLNQLVIDITRTENKEIEHSFEFGRPVCFFRQSFDGKVNYMNFIATVSYADDERMVVVLPSAGALLELQTEEVLLRWSAAITVCSTEGVSPPYLSMKPPRHSKPPVGSPSERPTV